ncbi:Ribonuclease H domain protein [Metarhizium robertsii ARSEF 23]|uniref:Ribonuclease H domain protein n=1 Tax=Metarhizium robertsii (strain ARSEF 23 / ATCC MYA-3075) TaxID=655844 RepID=E9FD16_METRA|nr:Ribonuclease H domain protein [Metarhizium robertsii ARSEF 23]EFY94394.2 Ribonuclease H domain protein [Metarhizium robertsii ARSEF 23]
MTIAEGQALQDQKDVEEQIMQENRQTRGRKASDGRKIRRCGVCGQSGHNARTCQMDGSPASPILFLLCTEPIYKLGFQLGRFGYADDTAILGTGRTLRETAKLATADVRELISWGAANGITFDPEKTEVMHFSHKKDDTSPSVTHGGIAKVPAEAIRWLGIWLDKKLTFRTHIEKWAAKVKKVAGHLHGLCNTKHGPLPVAVRRAVEACVEPILLYGMEAWYTGTESYTAWHGTKKVRPQIQHLVDKLDPVLRRAIRAILPVWKTTPVPIYHQESGIPPVPLLLEARRIRFAARLKSLDLAHPLAQRTDLTPIVRAVKRSCQVRGGGFKTRLERTALLLCSFPIVPDRPWSKPTKNKDESAADFLKWLEGSSSDELVVYSDGSQLPGGATGYGYAVHQNSVTICEGSGRLGPASWRARRPPRCRQDPRRIGQPDRGLLRQSSCGHLPPRHSIGFIPIGLRQVPRDHRRTWLHPRSLDTGPPRHPGQRASRLTRECRLCPPRTPRRQTNPRVHPQGGQETNQGSISERPRNKPRKHSRRGGKNICRRSTKS